MDVSPCKHRRASLVVRHVSGRGVRSRRGSSVEEEARREVQKFVNKGCLALFSSLEECVKELGGATPVASKFGMIVKVKRQTSRPDKRMCVAVMKRRSA